MGNEGSLRLCFVRWFAHWCLSVGPQIPSSLLDSHHTLYHGEPLQVPRLLRRDGGGGEGGGGGGPGLARVQLVPLASVGAQVWLCQACTDGAHNKADGMAMPNPMWNMTRLLTCPPRSRPTATPKSRLTILSRNPYLSAAIILAFAALPFDSLVPFCHA
ncbi:hypothetical protein AOQ84DRAFT_226784 [Glonium stellatum]|uniref:Uncharacterized protein n=1 Tax=Glonium stellatum TaxID=574774 RepID=A0A8E2F948_9PEZI|nr:hypothetical protein AOQ84DRAFT_226784 [Glonium stellatum]